MTHLYVVVTIREPGSLDHLRMAVARPWLLPHKSQVRYWVPSLQEGLRERAVLALAGYSSRIEGIEFFEGGEVPT